MAKKPAPSVSLRLTLKQAELLEIEFRNAIECGAEDPDFQRVLDKVQAEIARYRRASHGVMEQR